MAKEKTATKQQAAAVASKKKVTKKKKKLQVSKVLVKIRASYNNTIVSITDYQGNVVSYSSCGLLGFNGSKKSTAYAATRAGEDAAQKAVAQGAREAEVVINGIGIGRQATIKGVRTGGLRITSLADETPVPHGGCKPRKSPKK